MAEAWPPPPRCAYCGERAVQLVCGGEHDAWRGAGLCWACYWEVCLEQPTLPGTGRASGRRRRATEGDTDA